MTSNGETINEMMTKIFEYQDKAGRNCLIACYFTLSKYVEKGNNPHQTPMKKNIEEAIEFLIGMGCDNGVEMDKVINHVTKNGWTLFFMSTLVSEKVSLLLIRINIKVNEITCLFQTVHFQVN